MGSGTKIECRNCGRMVTLRKFKEEHTKSHPVCTFYKWWAWMYENDWKDAGRDRAVLELAGVTRILPVGRPYIWVRMPHPDGAIDQRTKEVAMVWKQELLTNFVHVAPKWAVELARKLMDDQALVLRFGKFKLEKRTMGTRRQLAAHQAGIKEKNMKAVIPLELRAKIVRIAAQNAMTREFAGDDLDVVLTIIRDSL